MVPFVVNHPPALWPPVVPLKKVKVAPPRPAAQFITRPRPDNSIREAASVFSCIGLGGHYGYISPYFFLKRCRGTGFVCFLVASFKKRFVSCLEVSS